MSSKAKIGQLDDCTSLILGGVQLGNDKVPRFDVTVVDALTVTEGDSIAHLGKHAGNETEAAVGKQLVGMKRGKA